MCHRLGLEGVSGLGELDSTIDADSKAEFDYVDAPADLLYKGPLGTLDDSDSDGHECEEFHDPPGYDSPVPPFTGGHADKSCPPHRNVVVHSAKFSRRPGRSQSSDDDDDYYDDDYDYDWNDDDDDDMPPFTQKSGAREGRRRPLSRRRQAVRDYLNDTQQVAEQKGVSTRYVVAGTGAHAAPEENHFDDHFGTGNSYNGVQTQLNGQNDVSCVRDPDRLKHDVTFDCSNGMWRTIDVSFSLNPDDRTHDAVKCKIPRQQLLDQLSEQSRYMKKNKKIPFPNLAPIAEIRVQSLTTGNYFGVCGVKVANRGLQLLNSSTHKSSPEDLLYTLLPVGIAERSETVDHTASNIEHIFRQMAPHMKKHHLQANDYAFSLQLTTPVSDLYHDENVRVRKSSRNPLAIEFWNFMTGGHSSAFEDSQNEVRRIDSDTLEMPKSLWKDVQNDFDVARFADVIHLDLEKEDLEFELVRLNLDSNERNHLGGRSSPITEPLDMYKMYYVPNETSHLCFKLCIKFVVGVAAGTICPK